MIRKTSILTVLLVFFSALLFANNAAAFSAEDKNLALRLVGTGSMYQMHVPGLEEQAMCFDVDVIDIKTNEMIATATDCLSNVQPKGDGLSILGTTFFYLPDGLITIRGKITAQPALEETVLKNYQPVTHTTGASHTDKGIIGGSGLYENSTGHARLSGLVDMSRFSANEGDLVSFDCLFIIDID